MQLSNNKFLAIVIATTIISTGTTTANVLEEIVVTATKRQESVQDIAVSVSALSGDQLSALNLSDMADITQQIPGFQVNAWSPQITIFNLRGVSQNNFTDNLEAPIAVYQDESYVASMNAISGQMFDMERVEVLRGPQGTLFGRNATGGLVHFISRGAEESELNGYIEVKAADHSRKSIEAAIGGSFSDTVRGRIAFKQEEADGYIKPMDIPPVDKRAIGGADGYGVRATLQVDFSDTLTGDFIIKSSSDNDVPTGGYVFENCDFDADEYCPTDASGRAIVNPGVVSGDPHVHMNDTKGFLERDVQSYTAKFTKDMGDIEFVSITNYMNMDKKYLEDGDAFPDPIVVFGQDAEVKQTTQEFRFSGETDSTQWQVGAYYMDYQFEGNAMTIGAPNIDLSFALADAEIISQPVVFDDNPFDGRSDRASTLDIKNISVFAQADFSLSETLSLTAGLRWSDDQKDINWTGFFSSDDQLQPVPYAATANSAYASEDTILNAFDEDSISYSDYAARLVLQKRFSDDTQGFVSWNRGIKGGNWSISSGVDPSRFVHDEEVLNSFELGIKSDINEYLRLNATYYYYDYKDYQTFVAIPSGGISPNPQIGNSDASAQGTEIELFITPVDNLDILVGMAFSDSEVDSVDAGSNPVLNAEFPNAPEFSANYLVRYALDLSDNNSLIFQVDGAFYGDQFLEVTNGQGTVQESYNVSNGSVTFQAGELSISLWTKNMFDETYKAYSLDLGVLGATTYYAPPRTSGLTLKYNF
jgi:iron complex outermembrane receptor protein|tara:strand:+ start:18763 stop:21039 length:2277 start_codon:yes stop_codon:yes gene_type:complete